MISTWTEQDIGFNYDRAGVVVFGGYLYQIGGGSDQTANDVTVNGISSAKINPDGSLGQARVVGTMTHQSLRACRMYQLGDDLILIGGFSGVSGINTIANVSRYRLERGGGIQGPFALAPMTNAVSSLSGFHTLPTTGSVGYMYGVNVSVGVESIFAFKPTASGPQNIRAIGLAVPSTGTTSGCALVMHKRNLIVVGGFVTGASVTTAIWAAKATEDSLGPWRRVGELPVAIQAMAATVVDNKLFVAGGIDVTSTRQTTVYGYVIDDDANLGPAQTLSTLVTAASLPGIAASKTHLYVVAGQGLGTSRNKTVQYAKLA